MSRYRALHAVPILSLCVALSCTRGAGGYRAQSVPVRGETFHDCPTCPDMIVIPAGTFVMGSSAAEKSWAATHGGSLASVADESPQHTVSIPSFALGKYDVTRDEYAAFVGDTRHSAGDGCQISPGANGFYDGTNPKKQSDGTWLNPGFAQTGRDPVVCVSWNDARAYVAWLNRKLARSGASSVNGSYRLPSESEWEYATRAGSTTLFWWGDDERAAADHAWYRDNSGGHTHPAGLKPANAFGLFDMVGNVWQWTQDCYADNYANARTDGTANVTDGNCLRVDRGGSWFYPTWLLRSAPRERNPADYRSALLGFRVARTLNILAVISKAESLLTRHSFESPAIGG
jgi:formylglycine-generating enzyme required for sulfatase activity